MKCDPKIRHRFSRVQGQMSGVERMMEDERSCEEIVTQLSAIRSSLDRLIATITTANLVESIENKHGIRVEDVESEVALIVKSK